MGKRQINKQQFARITKKQNAYQESAHPDSSLLADGLVISRFSRHAEVETSEGIVVSCSIRPNIDSLVAGDTVVWQQEGTEHGVIVSRYPRKTVLLRGSLGGTQKAVAANITQVIIVVAPKPEISWPLLDSYLIMTEALNLGALILLNKTDLTCDAIKERLIGDYQSIGYPVLFTGCHLKEGLSELLQALSHEVSVFTGQSGVGKSSIISALLPEETEIATQDVSTNKFGQHTTSNSRFYHLPKGGALIDSPGVREFSLSYHDPVTIIRGYREFSSYLSQCKFRNCNHISDAHCAIRKAVHEGNISSSRYANFVKLVEQNRQI